MMTAFYGFCLALMAVMRFAPQSPLGLWLNRNFVEQPLARMATLERHHLIMFVIVAAMLLGVGETIAIYGTFEWAIISAFDLSIYLDAVAVTAVLGAAARLRGIVQVLGVGRSARSIPKRAARRRRRKRVGAPTPAQKSANDDDPAPAFVSRGVSSGFHLAAA